MDSEKLKQALSALNNELKESAEAYARNLFGMSVVRPRVAGTLIESHRHRIQMIQHPRMSEWIAGIEELLSFLELVRAKFLSDRSLKKIAFLTDRLLRDFSAATELAISGIRSATFDTLRDTMEIEYLLIDFTHNKPHMDEWLRAKSFRELNKFQPVNLRKREADRRGLKDPSELQTNMDYKNHSENIHVTTKPSSTMSKGVHSFDGVMSMFPVFEIFFHGAGIYFAVTDLLAQYDDKEALVIDRFMGCWAEVKNAVHALQEILQQNEDDE